MHTPQPPQILLHTDLQQIKSKAYHSIYLLIVRQAQCLNTLRASFCVNGHALVVVGYCLLLCLLPVRGLKVGNILVLHPAVLAIHCVVLVPPALFVLVSGSLLTLFYGHHSNTLSSTVPRR